MVSCNAHLSTRRSFIKSIGTTATAAATAAVSIPFINSYAAKAATSASASGKPNILFIMADDLGWGDVGFTKDLVEDTSGRTRIQTPNLDSIAKSGIRFKQFYSGNCTCSPTRVSSFLGMKSERIGIQYACCGSSNSGIPWGIPTIPKLLATAGYSTGFIGKWHMGGYDSGSVTKRESGGMSNFPGPNDCGFDDAYFWDAGCHLSHEHAKPHTVYVGNPSSAECTRYNDALVGESKPGANLIENNTDYAMLLMEKYAKQSNPFYLQLWHFVPHAPTEHVDGYEDGCTGLTGGYADFCTMVHCLDHNMKRLFDKMEQLGIAENTFVMFTSDNGPHAGKASPLAGGKFDFKEGGIRMPSFAYWKGKIAAGGVCDQACTSTDLLPTFCDLGQAALPKVLVDKDYFDGVSIKETILSAKAVPNRQLYWKRTSNTGDGQAIIKNGRYKYHRTRKGEDVYTDLSVDPCESGKSTVPDDIKTQLKKDLDAWVKALPPRDGDAGSPCNDPEWFKKQYPNDVVAVNKPAQTHRRTDEVRISHAPFSGVPVIEFSNPSTRNVRIDILNLRGRILKTLINKRLGKGMHRYQIGAMKNAGTCLVRLQIGRKTIVRKIAIRQ